MKRHRPTTTTSPPAVPPELDRLVVEDWIDPLGFHPRWADAPTVEAWLFAAECEARRQWLTARRRHVRQLSLPENLLCDTIPLRSPRFADKDAFAEVIADRLQGPAACGGT